MKKITLPISGMHCRSCELILEKSIKNVKNVSTVEASERKWTLEISYAGTEPDKDEIEAIVIENGYTIGKKKILPWITKDPNDYRNIILTTLILFVLFIIISQPGWSLWEIGNTSSPTLAFAFLIGLTAWVSSCMALIGWLVLWISAEWNKIHSKDTLSVRFTPHIYFHLGRVIGFFILGGILGAFGSIINLSNIFLGFMTVLIGSIMFILGLNLTNLSPRIGNFNPTLPKFFGKNIHWENWTRFATFLTGIATFFLPCGFTLAMQIYAVSTGSFLIGGLTLAFFALGTLPWLLSLGFVSAILKGAWLKRFFVFTGVIVLGLGIFNIKNGYTLLSLWVPQVQREDPTEKENANQTENINVGDIQEIHMTQKWNGYEPNTLKIQSWKKVRWIINSTNPYSCASQIIVPSLWISEQLKAWENIIEFTAPEVGKVPFSCSMGMYRGTFIVE
jgi:sulfite exporter TauE/SafE/copper chaperone CopZ